jgi:hypothetical protein
MQRPRDPSEQWVTEEGRPRQRSNSAAVLRRRGGGFDGSEREPMTVRCSMTFIRARGGCELVCRKHRSRGGAYWSGQLDGGGFRQEATPSCRCACEGGGGAGQSGCSGGVGAWAR